MQAAAQGSRCRAGILSRRKQQQRGAEISY
jgi:hypothetical protein